MRYISQIIPLESEDFPFNIFDGNGETADDNLFMHTHKCLEINYAVAGKGCYFIGDSQYPISPGDLFVINNSEYHIAENRGGLLLKVIVFNPDMIWHGGNTLDYKYLQAFFEWKDSFKHHFQAGNAMIAPIFKLILEIEQEWTQRKTGYRLVIKSLLMQILALLYRGFEAAEPYAQKILKFQENYNRIVDAVTYIDQHYYSSGLSLDCLAELVHMSPNYFSKFFKDVMGVTVTAYIARRRVDHACMLLQTTELSMTEISISSGFSTVSHFNKVFKEHTGKTPLPVRRDGGGLLERTKSLIASSPGRS